uniref:Uncharacterized protein n=1 Tax=Setaria italica TaxID=4555 RepID=K3ZGB5_SETIT
MHRHTEDLQSRGWRQSRRIKPLYECNLIGYQWILLIF